MSDTETMRFTSGDSLDEKFMREFGDRVESVEFLRRRDGLEFRSTYRLARRPVEPDIAGPSRG